MINSANSIENYITSTGGSITGNITGNITFGSIDLGSGFTVTPQVQYLQVLTSPYALWDYNRIYKAGDCVSTNYGQDYVSTSNNNIGLSPAYNPGAWSVIGVANIYTPLTGTWTGAIGVGALVRSKITRQRGKVLNLRWDYLQNNQSLQPPFAIQNSIPSNFINSTALTFNNYSTMCVYLIEAKDGSTFEAHEDTLELVHPLNGFMKALLKYKEINAK